MHELCTYVQATFSVAHWYFSMPPGEPFSLKIGMKTPRTSSFGTSSWQSLVRWKIKEWVYHELMVNGSIDVAPYHRKLLRPRGGGLLQINGSLGERTRSASLCHT